MSLLSCFRTVTHTVLPLFLLFSPQTLKAQVYDGVTLMRQPMTENLCAITFDDGPSRYTPYILDVLREHTIPATFFMLGKNALLYPDHVRRIVAEGHETGNHSFSHPNLRRIPLNKKKEEIAKTDKILRDLGANPIYMRPPYGAYDNDVVTIARELGATIMLWSVDSQDWKRRPSDYGKIINAVGRPFPTGQMRGILLFHDPLKNTAYDLPKIISDLKASGCQRFVTVSEYLESTLDPNPPLLMVQKNPAAPVSEQTPESVAAPQESAELMPPESYQEAQQSWPAGSTPMPMARSSKPWKESMPVTTAMPGIPSEEAPTPMEVHTPAQGAVGTMHPTPQNSQPSSVTLPPDRHGVQPITDGLVSTAPALRGYWKESTVQPTTR